jgi:predicted Co/Zn/Cd cation transporter (cation efflux family)
MYTADDDVMTSMWLLLSRCLQFRAPCEVCFKYCTACFGKLLLILSARTSVVLFKCLICLTTVLDEEMTRGMLCRLDRPLAVVFGGQHGETP